MTQPIESTKKSHVLLHVTSIISLLLFLGLGIFVLIHDQNANKVQGLQNTREETQNVQANPYQILYQGQDGKTALELLKSAANIETKQSSYGEYVDSVNSIKAGTENKYWIFYVNGKMAEVGADAYQTQNSDLIEWRFE